ncbi:MAG: MTH895/ArsE family thioredoxin-like protein [Hydrogenovibrio sp.]|uniref:MTH895/ArsE family thioredoxin-like protein n=1 Tax=Hydrogenovibrio sp. TaxID=2065821 RepID=UPI0028706AEF|nr:MTH895/ArsE family thioredoxin-like protein [Hydrogenovibrio sp.]MDR9499002.1 MTH895/ArsE family thioredoxin-like protein [Hydrogenovibrio sp.]
MKGNLMVRLMTGLILIGIALAQFSGQTDLMSANWLWLAVLPALMGFQATFTGWCPAELIGKLSKSGECCPGGSCGTAPAPQKATPKSEANIDGSADENAKASACCGGDEEEKRESSGCCSDSAPSSAGCCGGDSEKSPGLVVQVLGTGCKTCHNTVTRIEETAGKMGAQVSVQKVEDVAEIASFGVTATPGVVIDDTVVHSGGMPSVAQIEQWLADAPAKPEKDLSGKAGV